MIVNNNNSWDKKKKKIQYRGGFSDRNGINKIPTQIQLKEFDERTKIAICNQIFAFIKGDNLSCYFTDIDCELFFKELIEKVYYEPVADFSFSRSFKTDYYKEYIEEPIIEGDYADILTLIEFIVDFSSKIDGWYYLEEMEQRVMPNVFMAYLFNNIFEKEYVGYRIIDNKAIPISDEQEQTAIQEALGISFDGCRSHIQKALGFLSDREKPDYKNSIKESISAVEAVCQIITKNNKATLGQALKFLEDSGVKLHSALKSSFSSLYGYTSDEGGIRHAEGLFKSNVTFDEAKYMLVSCSAFVNYLIAEYGKVSQNEE